LKPKHPLRTEECRPVSEILARIGDKWSVLVVHLLGRGSLRFSALRKMIEGISQKMLTTTLRGLERDGFVTRTVYPTTPPSVSYDLTDLGRDLLVPVTALAEWAHKNQPLMDEARRKFDEQQAHASNGARSVPLPIQLRP
jgi:DNA-binding HxlR family transcriptional regulator